MEGQAIIVVGASAGGLEALTALVGGLPRDLPAAVCVVLHIGSRPSMAPDILRRAGALPAKHAVDGETIRPGRIVLAPPDHHLLVIAPGRFRLSRGPRENGTRPAADPLFRSAAQLYGVRVIGVILSGMLNDGTAGFSDIKRCGGVTVVQDPDDARCPGMPRSALQNTTVDHCAHTDELGPLLARLVRAMAPLPAAVIGGAKRPKPSEEDAAMEGEYDLNTPVSLTCPECGGALREVTMDSMPYFTCHIGHRYGADSMDEEQFRAMEKAFETALRALNERTAMCRRLAEVAQNKGQSLSAGRWAEAGREARERAEILINFLSQDWIRPSPGTNDDEQSGQTAG